MHFYRDIADQAALDREYSPSSLSGDPAPFLGAYARRSLATRRDCPGFRTIRYGAAAEEHFDFFPAASALRGQGAPAMVFIHGGYWQELSKDEHSFPATDFLRHDISYIAINYGLAPAAPLSRLIGRCREAFAAIFAQSGDLGIDPGRIHLSGHSAGAHLAAMVALPENPARPACGARTLTLLGGVFDLRPIALSYVNGALGLNQREAMAASPLLLVDGAQGSFPPTLVAVGAVETGEFKRQSLEFAQALSRKGAAVTHREIALRHHFDLIDDFANEATALGATVLRHLAHPATAGQP